MATYSTESLKVLYNEVQPEELFHILDELMYDYARYALMANEPPSEAAAGHLYYLKFIRDTLCQPA
jgi:hypothetical protein